MLVVPVMDLLAGQVVRGIAGDRANYRPIRSSLAASAEPVAVLRALMRLARFPALYVADLDAITQAGSDRHFEVLKRLGQALTECGASEFWLDAGAAEWLPDLAAALPGIRLVPVLGSESLSGDAAMADCVLSLDYQGGIFLGPPGLDASPQRWPRRVIVMELAAVGSRRGPAIDRLQRLTDTANSAGRTDIGFFAAGGVRDARELDHLAEQGIAGVLLASSLHDGAIDGETLRRYAGQ